MAESKQVGAGGEKGVMCDRNVLARMRGKVYKTRAMYVWFRDSDTD